MLAIGCIQAQRCHTGHCPAGVATQSNWLMKGLDPSIKANRVANYLYGLQKEMLWISHACGVAHPALLTTEHFELVDDQFGSKSVTEQFGYEHNWGLPGAADRSRLLQLV
jgi:glutamate synthase domain-containing protein 2